MTRHHLPAFLLVTLALLLTGARPAHAAQSYDNCTGFITSLPAVISTQGTWCFKQDLATAITSGTAITINTNNVTIDCNDFKLGGLAAGAGTSTYGIYSIGRLNSTIRHCNIRGFYRGIFLDTPSGGNVIEDNRFDNNTWMAADTHGDGSVIRRNRFFDTGGTTTIFFAGGVPVVTYDNADIIDNTISGVTALSGSNLGAYGIYTVDNHAGTISGNRIRDLVKDGTGVEMAIYVTANDRIHIHDNDLVSNNSIGNVAIHCDSTNARVRNNNISAFADAYSTCGNAGGNDLGP